MAQNGPVFHISDGQTLTADIEKQLESMGYLVAGKNAPTLTLYAQWLAEEVTIQYSSASTTGGVALYTDKKSSSRSVKETLRADSGAHPGNANKSAGPEGANAKPSTGYHFVRWTVAGTDRQLTEAEATKASLPSSVVSRLSYYPSRTTTVGEYHSLSFTASFAPNTYTIKYGANGGTGDAGSTSLQYGYTANAASDGVTRDGYELAGWNTAADGSGVAVGLGSTIDSSTLNTLISRSAIADVDGASTTLYAQWNKIAEPTPDPEPEPEPAPEPEPEPTPAPEPEPEPEPEPTPTPTPAPTPTRPTPAPEPTPVVSFVGDVVSTVVEAAVDATAKTTETATDAKVADGEKGLLASASDKSDKKSDSANGDTALVVRESYSDMGGSGSGGSSSEDGGILNELMSPEGVKEAGTTVAAVAAVGALAGLVGVGVSVAGAAMVGAATIGTASAIGLTSAADLAADLAAAGAAGAAGAGAARKRRDEDDDAKVESGPQQQA